MVERLSGKTLSGGSLIVSLRSMTLVEFDELLAKVGTTDGLSLVGRAVDVSSASCWLGGCLSPSEVCGVCVCVCACVCVCVCVSESYIHCRYIHTHTL